MEKKVWRFVLSSFSKRPQRRQSEATIKGSYGAMITVLAGRTEEFAQETRATQTSASPTVR